MRRRLIVSLLLVAALLAAAAVGAAVYQRAHAPAPIHIAGDIGSDGWNDGR